MPKLETKAKLNHHHRQPRREDDTLSGKKVQDMTPESNEQMTDVQTRNQNSSPPPGSPEGRDGGRRSDSSLPGNLPGGDGTNLTINTIK